MRYVAMWSLKRGIIEPAEQVDSATQFQLEREYRAARQERDPPMTQEQRWMEEAYNYGYRTRKTA